MILLCPGCRALVDATAVEGGNLRCPKCQHEFAAPQRYEPEVLSGGGSGVESSGSPASSGSGSPPAGGGIAPPPITPPLITPPMPGRTAPGSGGSAVAGPGVPPPELPAGYTRSLTLSFTPGTLRWCPAVLLPLALLCTFFPWVTLSIGGSTVYAQGPWRALFGRVYADAALVEVSQWPTEWVERVGSDALLVLPALLLLILAVLVAWAERELGAVDFRKIPPLAGFWPWRRHLLLLASAAALVLLLIQSGRGWGLERALHQAVNERFAQQWNEALPNPVQLALVKYKMEQELHRYNLGHTHWQYLGLGSLVLAVLTLLATEALDRRGQRPPPRLVIQY